MKKISFSILLVITFFFLHAQYRYDNVKYKTVYLEDLCQAIRDNPGFVLLDVRSKGEFNDTSAYQNYNIGHLSNAINIDIHELPNRLKDLNAYKNIPVFVYCSHSQRSRRASSMLSDSGFAKVFNINGGLTSFRVNDVTSVCNLLSVQSNLPYTYISPGQLSKIIDKKKYTIIDLREDSSFRSISSDESKNAMGRFNNSINIPFKNLANNMGMIKDRKDILLVDEYGTESVKGAELLSQNGFKNISVLFDGLDMWISEVPAQERHGWESAGNYNLINAYLFSDLIKKETNTVVLDIRTKAEYANLAKENWRNIGKIRNSVNIPYSELKTDPSILQIPKNAPIIIYDFSSQPELFSAAKLLSAMGYTNLNVLMGGIFNLRWKAANIKGKNYLNQWVVNVPDYN